MREREEAFRILEAALSIASTGVDEAEVGLGGGDLGITTFADNQIESSVEESTEVLSMRVVLRGRSVRVTTSDLSTPGIKELAQQARTRVEHLPEQAMGPGLPEPQSYDETEAYDRETEAMRPMDRDTLAGRAILAAHKHNLLASGTVTARRGSIGADGRPYLYAIANTRGLLAFHGQTRLGFRVSMQKRSGGVGFAEDESHALAGIDADALVARASQRAQVGGDIVPLTSGVLPVILEPAAVAELLRHVGPYVGGDLVAAGASFLSGRIGERISSDLITLYDDHTHPLHRSAPFDLEGVARRRVMLIEEGIARGAVYGWDSAARHGVEPTGHRDLDPNHGELDAASHLVLEGGFDTPEELMRGLDRGVVVSRLCQTQLLDPRTMTITGSTFGLFVVERGDLVAPAADMRFSIRLFELLGAVTAMTTAVWAGGAVVPAVRVDLPLVAVPGI